MTLGQLVLNLLVYLLHTFAMLIQLIELVDELLIVFHTQVLFHLLNVLDLILLSSYLLLHFLHDPLIPLDFALHIIH